MNCGQLCLPNVRTSWICPPSLQVWCPHAAQGQRSRLAPVRVISVATPNAHEAAWLACGQTPEALQTHSADNGAAGGSPYVSTSDQHARPDSVPSNAGISHEVVPRGRRKRRRKAAATGANAACQLDPTQHIMPQNASSDMRLLPPRVPFLQLSEAQSLKASESFPEHASAAVGPSADGGSTAAGSSSSGCTIPEQHVNGGAAGSVDGATGDGCDCVMADRRSSNAQASSSGGGGSQGPASFFGNRARRSGSSSSGSRDICEGALGGTGRADAPPPGLHQVAAPRADSATTACEGQPSGVPGLRAASDQQPANPSASTLGSPARRLWSPLVAPAPRGSRRRRSARFCAYIARSTREEARAAASHGGLSSAAVAASAAAVTTAAAFQLAATASLDARRSGPATTLSSRGCSSDSDGAPEPSPPAGNEPSGFIQEPGHNPEANLPGETGAVPDPGFGRARRDGAAWADVSRSAATWVDDVGHAALTAVLSRTKAVDGSGRLVWADGASDPQRPPRSSPSLHPESQLLSQPAPRQRPSFARRTTVRNVAELRYAAPALADLPLALLTERLAAVADLLRLSDPRIALRLAQAVPNLLVREPQALADNLAALVGLLGQEAGGPEAVRRICACEPLLLVMPPERILGSVQMYRSMLLLSGRGARSLVARFPKLLVFKPETMARRIVNIRRLLCPGYSAAAAAGAGPGVRPWQEAAATADAAATGTGALAGGSSSNGSGDGGARATGEAERIGDRGGAGGRGGDSLDLADALQLVKGNKRLRAILHQALHSGPRGMLDRPDSDRDRGDGASRFDRSGSPRSPAAPTPGLQPAIPAASSSAAPSAAAASAPSHSRPRYTRGPSPAASPSRWDVAGCFEWACGKYVGWLVQRHPILLTFASRVLVSHMARLQAQLGPVRLRRMLAREPLILWRNPRRVQARMATLRAALDCEAHPQAVEALVTRRPHALKRSKSALAASIRSLSIWRMPPRAKVRLLFARPRLLTLSPREISGRCRWLRAFMLSNAYYHSAFRRAPPSVLGVLLASLFQGWARLLYLAETEQEGEMQLVQAVECPQQAFEERFPEFGNWRKWKVQQMGTDCPWRREGHGEVCMPVGITRKPRAGARTRQRQQQQQQQQQLQQRQQSQKPQKPRLGPRADLHELLQRRQELQQQQLQIAQHAQQQPLQQQPSGQPTTAVVIADEGHVRSGGTTVLRPRRVVHLPTAQESAPLALESAPPAGELSGHAQGTEAAQLSLAVPRPRGDSNLVDLWPATCLQQEDQGGAANGVELGGSGERPPSAPAVHRLRAVALATVSDLGDV